MFAVCLQQENSCRCSMTDILWLTSICSHMQLVFFPKKDIMFGVLFMFKVKVVALIKRTYHPHCVLMLSCQPRCDVWGRRSHSDALGSASLPLVMLLIFPRGDGTETYEPSERDPMWFSERARRQNPRCEGLHLEWYSSPPPGWEYSLQGDSSGRL